MPTETQLDFLGRHVHSAPSVASLAEATVGAVERVLVTPAQPIGPAHQERKPMLPLGSYRGARSARVCAISGEEWIPHRGRPPPL